MNKEKYCIHKWSCLLDYAIMGLHEIEYRLNDTDAQWIHKYLDEERKKLQDMASQVPRNCKYPEHRGTCLIFCDCGECPYSNQYCQSQGD